VGISVHKPTLHLAASLVSSTLLSPLVLLLTIIACHRRWDGPDRSANSHHRVSPEVGRT
jgi:hypothetical protein